MKTGKIKSFFPGKKSKMKKSQLFPTIFLMKIMKKSPVMKLRYYYNIVKGQNSIITDCLLASNLPVFAFLLVLLYLIFIHQFLTTIAGVLASCFAGYLTVFFMRY